MPCLVVADPISINMTTSQQGFAQGSEEDGTPVNAASLLFAAYVACVLCAVCLLSWLEWCVSPYPPRTVHRPSYHFHRS